MLSLDQLRVFLAVVEEGSFSAAARRLGRAQSAVTYAIQELEADARLPLFDRSKYRPHLNDAGRALLPRARRIVGEVSAFQVQAEGLAGGLEAKLTLVVDSMFPFAALAAPFREFQAHHPSVLIQLHVESLGAAADMVVDGNADLGLVLSYFTDFAALDSVAAVEIDLAPVCAPGHALARLHADTGAPLSGADVDDQLQLVLADRSPRTQHCDQGIASSKTWRIADLGAKLAMIRIGLGWGSLPRHMVASDLAEGRLTELKLERWPGSVTLPQLESALVRRSDASVGPAGRWLYNRLSHLRSASDSEAQ